MKNSDILLIFSALLAVASILFAGFNIISYGILNNLGTTGFVAGNQTTGIVNLTIQASVAINFTVDLIEWGTGRVDTGSNNATLDTSRNSTYKVLNGNWSWLNVNNGNRTEGFILENIGNSNVSLWLATSKNATQFIGGNNPGYQFNITNNESNSCTNSSGVNLGDYYDVNTTGIGTRVCSNLGPGDTQDAIRLDVKLRIPSGSQTGTLTDTITATAIAS
jgi:hypothetical protein